MSPSLLQVLLTGRTFGIPNYVLVPTVVGEILWVLVYIQIIVHSFRTKSHGMPVFAACMSLSLEFIFGFVCPWTQPNLCPDHSGGVLWAWRFCFLLQVVILFQCWIYRQNDPGMFDILNRYSALFFAAQIVVCLIGEYTFIVFNQDFNANQTDFIVNLVISTLFVFLYIMTPQLRGLSYLAAWTKGIANTLMAVTLLMVLPNPAWRQQIYRYKTGSSFIYFLLITIFFFDCTYIVLLARRRRTSAPA